MSELYVCAGLFAEGPTDYYFLQPLLDRLLDDLLARHYTSRYTLAESHGIDAAVPQPKAREARIAAAIDAYWDRCTLFIIHTDGSPGDPATQRQRLVDPGIAAARSAHERCPIAACVPVRETEAWLLADPAAFAERLGPGPHELPADPERVADPKAALKTIFAAAKSTFSSPIDYAFFGNQVGLPALRRLPAFQAFERELLAALRLLADS